MLTFGDPEHRVVAISVPFPGVCEWLRHGAEVGLWQLRVFEESDGNQPISLPEGDAFVLGAWHPAYSQVMGYLRHRDEAARVVVAWSSSVGEMDHAQIEVAFSVGIRKWLASKDPAERIDAVGCLHPGVRSIFGERSFHLPAPVAVPPPVDAPAWEERSGIGFYAPATLKKNALAQIMAVGRVQQRWVERAWLFTNLDKYAPALEGWGVRHTIEPWLEDRAAHLARLARMRVALAASTAESWCYGAVDAMSVNVPVVGSPTVGWLPEEWRVHDANDPRDIAARIERLLDESQDVAPRDILFATARRQNEAARRAVAEHVLVEGGRAACLATSPSVQLFL